MCTSVVSGCNAPPVLEFGKQVLNSMADFVERLAVFDWFFAVFPGWNAGCDFLIGLHVSDFVAVIAFVP